MLTPNKMNNLQNNKLVDIYTAINQELTNDIINKIKSSEDITNYTKSQIKALIKNGGQEIFNEALKKVQGISRSTLNELKTIFNDLVNSQMSGYKSTFDAVGATYAVTDSMMKTINNAIKETNGTLKNMTKTVAYASQTDFVNAMDNLYMKVTSGAFDYDTALKRTVADLAKKGVTFKTSDGRNEKIETVVKRNLFSSIQNTATDLAKEIGDIIDYNCVVIGHSYKCRPTHHPIDDVVMSKEVFKRYEYLTYEYNCNHIVNYDWREEFENNPNKIEYGDQHGTLKEVKKNYEIQQKANYYANQVKNKKMQIANGDNSEEVKRELLNAQVKYRTFCKTNGLTVDYSKTWVHGYNKAKPKNIVNLKPLKYGDKFTYKGKEYVFDGINTKYDLNAKEQRFAEWISQYYSDKTVIINPTINKPDGISTADLTIGGELYDMKIITGSSNQVIYHNVYGKQEQASNFLFEASNSSLTLDELKNQVYKVFKRTDVMHVKKIGIKKGSDFILLKKE